MNILQGLRSTQKSQWPGRMPAVKGFEFSAPMPGFRGNTAASGGFEDSMPLQPVPLQSADGENAVVLLPTPGVSPKASTPPVPNFPPKVNPPSPADPMLLGKVRDRMRQTRANLRGGMKALWDNYQDPFARYPQLAAAIPGSSKEVEQLQAQDFMPQARPRYV